MRNDSHSPDLPALLCWRALPLLLLCFWASLAHAGWVTTGNTLAVPNGEYGRSWTALDTVSDARANAVYVDDNGDVYSTGYRDNGNGTQRDILIAKHDSAGNLIWEASRDNGNSDEGLALTVDAAGNVYVAAVSYNGSDADFLVLKYLPSGTLDWSASYDNAGADDEPVAIVSDGSNVYVTGRSAKGGNLDILTIRYDAAGLNRQVQIYDNGGDDHPVGIGLGAAGEVYVGGVSDAVDNDYVLLKYSSGLASLLWTVRHDSGQRDDATAMAVDGTAGRVYLTGWSFSGGIRNYRTVAFNGTDGSEVWVAITDYLSGNHIPAAITSTGSAVFVTGKSIYRQNLALDSYQLLTIAYDAASGAESIWPARQLYDSGSDDEALALAVDGVGNAYVLGQSGVPGSRNLSTVLYDATGTQRAVFSYDAGGDETGGGLIGNSTQRVTGQAIALGADVEGLATVHIAGGSNRPLPASGSVEGDYTLVKYGVMRPDLQVASLGGPALGASGNAINITNIISNIRDSTTGILSDSGSFAVGLYVADSPDPATANLFLLGTRGIANIATGQSDTAVTAVTIPPAAILPEGLYYLAAQADILGDVTERDETNNLLIGAAINIVDPPDLVPSSIAVTNPPSGAAPAASTITLEYVIDNIRAVATSGPFQVNFVLSSDGVVGNGDDIPLGSDTVTSIINGNSSLPPTSVVVTIPNTTPAGAYFIGIIVDTNNDVLEASDTNNTLTSSATFTVQPIPDLTVSAVAATLPSAVVGSTMDIDYTVLSSNAAASNVGVSFYLSSDALITTADTLLGNAPPATLAADTPLSATATVTVPTVTQGVYYVGAIIDPANTIVESDDANNDRSAAQTTSIGLPAGSPGALPDLMISAVTAPTSAARGDTITVSTSVANILPEAVVNPFKVGIYLSADTAITSSDILLGFRPVASLAGNSTDSADSAVTIPFEAPQAVIWTNAVGVSVSGNSLTKTTATGWGNSGAASQQAIPGNGAVEFTASETNTRRVVGLSLNDTDQGPASIGHAIRLEDDGYIYIYENGTWISSAGFWSYVNGDVLRIERTGSTIRYWQNGVLRYTSGLPSSGPLVVDTALHTSGATISNVNLIVTLTPGTYYIGAIADHEGVIAEVNESNNAAVQSAGGTVISVLQGNGAAASGGGGGALNPLFWVLLAAVQLLRLRRWGWWFFFLRR